MNIIIRLVICLIIALVPAGAAAQETVLGSVSIDFKGRMQEVKYQLRMPANLSNDVVPVVVCLGGLPIINGEYVHSDTGECHFGQWLDFADEYNVGLLGVGFLFVEEDWPKKISYQYAQVWSGQALMEILEKLEDSFSLDKNELYMFGISAGAQFSVRFAQFQPERVKAVTAHAAGGYDPMVKSLPSKFLITVGALDNSEVSRVEFAKMFVEDCQQKSGDCALAIIPDIGHVQTEHQNHLSREFIKKVLNQ